MSEALASIVLGAGPAGVGPLVCAMQRGCHAQLLSQGVAWVDAGTSFGDGSIGRHAISSDTAASVLLECLGGEENPLACLVDSAEARCVAQYGNGSLPLTAAAAFLKAVGGVAREIIAAHPPSEAMLGTPARRIVARGPGELIVELADGRQRRSRSVVMALGGEQSRHDALSSEILPGLRLQDGFAHKSVLTGGLFAHGGVSRLTESLAGHGAPCIVIIGSSHSALTTAHLLIDSGIVRERHAVTLLYRRRPKIYYPDEESARADEYADFDADDICPRTGRVYRLAGLRMSARDLLRRTWGLGGSAIEERLRLLPLDSSQPGAVRALLEQASVIVPAFGYRPRTLPVVDANGQPIALRAETGPRQPLVDPSCRVLRADGAPVPGLYGIGLASGFVPRGPQLGGEPSFDGQTNGLWLYQNGVGAIVLEHMLAARSACVQPS